MPEAARDYISAELYQTEQAITDLARHRKFKSRRELIRAAVKQTGCREDVVRVAMLGLQQRGVDLKPSKASPGTTRPLSVN